MGKSWVDPLLAMFARAEAKGRRAWSEPILYHSSRRLGGWDEGVRGSAAITSDTPRQRLGC